MIAPRTILRRAAHLIERDGWTTGTFGPPGEYRSPRCILGAVAAVTGGALDIEAVDAIREELTERGVHTGRAFSRGIVRWNDRTARGYVEVIEVLQSAARRARGRR